MKKIISMVAAVLIAFFSFAQSHYPKLDDKYGYKDLTFEMNEADFKTKVKNIPIETKEPGIKKYKITDSKYMIVGDCHMDIVYANFFQNKLMSINIKTKGEVNFSCLLDALNSLFGKAFQSNQYIEEYAWIGEKVFAMFKQNSFSKDGDLYMNSEVVMKDFQSFNKNRGKSNSTDF